MALSGQGLFWLSSGSRVRGRSVDMVSFWGALGGSDDRQAALQYGVSQATIAWNIPRIVIDIDAVNIITLTLCILRSKEISHA
jgi:hypothetical protein